MTDRPAPAHAARSALATLLAAVGLLLTLAGCGPVEVRSAPPGSDLDGVRIDGDTLVLRVLVVNRNDVPLALTGAALEVTLGSQTLEPQEWPLALVIGPRSREAVELRLAASDAVLGAFEALQRGERQPLAYELSGRWTSEGSRDGRIQRSGFLHPVPGRPGRFR
ncbi:LEA type 2 family protein [Wenzhouxiangella sp. XN79A]|uniref:LEA type 2 family protein n=1 Tax=Wenzhouxiangella sp. XN79A TaxID=2724193 RepID=UPI00144A5C15|nr:LEA type 2 family protein [Wenzhouxiangella sp. XN79A]NKI34925.1 LEA type 2 family protein [Wenzhouxiangella sp. XN79A]